MLNLIKAFDTYKKKYFKNKLPECRVIWSSECFKDNQMGCLKSYPLFEPATYKGREVIWCNHRHEIRICKTLRKYPLVASLTLMHEMVHLEQFKTVMRNKHGHIFQRRMKQLAARGAFNHLW